MKSLFIVNPSAGIRVLQNNVHTLSRMLLQNGVVTENNVYYTQKGGDAFTRAKEIKKGEYDFVVAVGGDGTANEVVNGIIAGGSEVPMTILGAGTTNDFVSALGISSTAAGMYKMIKDFRLEKVDVGEMNGHYFLNVASGGMISEIAHKITKEQKSQLGKFAYYIEGAKEITNLKKLKTAKLHYEWDEGEFDDETFLLVVCNSCQSGGFQKIAPCARLNDGLLDVCIIKKLKPDDIIPLFNKIQAGNHPNDPRTNYFTTHKLRVTKSNDSDHFSLDYDGENAGEMPMEVVSHKGAITMIVPKKIKNKKLFEKT